PRPSQPAVNRPAAQPKVGGGPSVGQPKVGGGPSVAPPKIGNAGPGAGARDGPGVVSPPKLTPGTRPSIDSGKGPGINQPKVNPPKVNPPNLAGKGAAPGIGAKAPGVGSKPGIGKVDSGVGAKAGGGVRPGGA